MKISIALCTYNCAKYLQVQLDSYLQQSRLPDELVVCDNDSQDETVQLLETFQSKAPFVVKIEKNGKNIGFNKNFDKAISLCEGDLIFLSDADDYWLPEKIQVTEELFQKDPELLLSFSNEYLGDENLVKQEGDFWNYNHFTAEERRFFHSNDGYRLLLKKTIATGHTLTFRKSLKDKILPIPEKYMFDAWIIWIATLLGKVESIVQPLVIYRLHGKQNVGILSQGLFQRIAQRFRRAEKLKKSRYLGIAEESHLLQEKIKTLGLPVEKSFKIETLLHERKKFFQDKANYSSIRIFRAPKICAHWLRGDYACFENGSSSAIKDFIASKQN